MSMLCSQLVFPQRTNNQLLQLWLFLGRDTVMHNYSSFIGPLAQNVKHIKYTFTLNSGMKYLLSAISDNKRTISISLEKLSSVEPQAKPIHTYSFTHIDTHFNPASIHPCDFMDTFLSIKPGDGMGRTENDSERIAQ